MDYKSKRWLELREGVLRRDEYMCRLSRRYGKLVQAEHVHHIFPADDFPEYQHEPWNLISLSRSMHDKMHHRETRKLTDAGRELLRRTARQQGIQVPEEYMK